MLKTTTICAVAFAAAGTAFAGPVSFDYEGTAQGRNVHIDVDGGIDANVYAGSIKHRVDGELLMTYCVDPDQWAQSGVTNFERTQLWKTFDHRPYAREKANAIAELADSVGSTLWDFDTNRDTAAAFQLAVWEIVKDFNPENEGNTFDFTSGAFKASGDAGLFSLAGNMLSGLDFIRDNDLGYVGYGHDQHQDFMGQAIPAPGAIALGLAGMPLLARRRRSARQA